METPLKIYFIPFFAQGHQIPLVRFARLVASRGHHVTIITTPANVQLFEEDKSCGGGGGQQHMIHLHTVKFPSTQVGLPDGVENCMTASDNVTAYKLNMAVHFLQPEIEAFMKQSPPDVLIADIMFTWSEASCKRLGIPRLSFNAISIFDICIIEAIRTHPEAFASDSGPYHVPGLPHSITLDVKPSPAFSRFMESQVEAEKGGLGQGTIVNSFADLDAGYTEHYEKLTGRKVWHIGPTSLMVQQPVVEHECLTWLSSKEDNSVIYICFGSMCILSDEQLFQIAKGLEASGRQFLWVVHRSESKDEEQHNGSGIHANNKWLPEGFQEKVIRKENRGMMIMGWAPQVAILNHPAIGGFLTQCGWSSMVEAIGAGLPMITMPGFGDQYYLEKLITVVLGFGVEVGGAEWSPSPYERKKNVVSGERIEKAVKSLMSEESAQIGSKAKELQHKSWKAVQQGGSSYNTLTTLIDHLRTLVPKPPAN